MFIELTKLTYGAMHNPPRKQNVWESPILVNTSTITNVEILDECSQINFVGGTHVTVKETVELKGRLID